MSVKCYDISGELLLTVILYQPSKSKAFERMGDWYKLVNADQVDDYCMELHENYMQFCAQ